MGITSRIDNITLVREEYQHVHPPCPESVKIELVPRCNYRCGYCALRMRDCQPKARDDMALEDFKRITLEMAEAGVKEIGLFYLGESLMNPRLTADACRWCKEEIGIEYVFLTTNGSLASEDVIHALMWAGLDSLKFSINAADPDQFEEIMEVKAGYFHDSLTNLRQAKAIRDKHKYKTRLYASSIRYDAGQQDRMESLVRNFVKPFVDEWYELPLYSMGSMATEREAELGYRPTAGNQGRIGKLRKPLPCWSAFTEGHVRADLGVSLCCFDNSANDDRFLVGSLKDQSWMDVWHSQRFAEIRAAHLAENLKSTPCEECVAY
jgi:MoaA/NifB/PqqE/SkfB family radical SAM enzyme